MSDSYGFGEAFNGGFVDPQPDSTKETHKNLQVLGVSAGQFANAITKAFGQATTGGKQFDDVLKGLALKLSNLAVQNAFKPIAKDLVGVFGGLFGGDGSSGPVLTAFAAGGVINTPGYFPLSGGGLGLAGEAGPEAIVPLSRGADGRLGIAGGGSQGGNITVQISTPDAGSFRHSEAYITGQIARAVSRGQRGF